MYSAPLPEDDLGYLVETIGRRGFPSGHFQVDPVHIYNGPAFDEPGLAGFLVTFFRLAQPVMDIGKVGTTFYLNGNDVSVNFRSICSRMMMSGSEANSIRTFRLAALRSSIRWMEVDRQFF